MKDQSNNMTHLEFAGHWSCGQKTVEELNRENIPSLSEKGRNTEDRVDMHLKTNSSGFYLMTGANNILPDATIIDKIRKKDYSEKNVLQNWNKMGIKEL